VTEKTLPPIVSVAIRWANAVVPVAAHRTLTGPVPDVGLAVSQSAELETVHGQGLGVGVTFTKPNPPLAITVAAAGERLVEHVAEPCVTVTVVPSIATLAVRAVPEAFRTAAMRTTPGPVPPAVVPDGSSNPKNSPRGGTIQLHPVRVVTVTSTKPPAAGSATADGETV
jgi:hypothetical protein